MIFGNFCAVHSVGKSCLNLSLLQRDCKQQKSKMIEPLDIKTVVSQYDAFLLH